ncbi:sensor histidine kinase [Algoriphagus namhaensis]
MEDQAERLKILHSYRILDTEREEGFDNLTRIAAKVCGTEVSLISLVDEDRQWFKSHHGIEIKQTPLRQSVCKNLVYQDRKFLHLKSLKSSPEYRDHPGRTELGFEFYAGFPIKNADGTVLGSFCVLDFVPHELSESQLEILEGLADQAMRLIEAHKQREDFKSKYLDLQTKSEVIDRGTMIAKLGGFAMNMQTQYIFWVEGTNRLFDLPAGFHPGYDEITQPEKSAVISTCPDCLKVLEIIADLYDQGDGTKTQNIEGDTGKCFYVIVQKEGSEISCVIRDQTDLQRMQQELEKSQNLMTEVEALSKVGGWEINPLTKEVHWTANSYEIFEVAPEMPLSIEMLNKFYVDESFKEVKAAFTHAKKTGEGYVAERQILTDRNTTKWVRVKVRPVLSKGTCIRVFGSFQDITHEVKLRNELENRKEQALSKANYFQSLVDNQSFFILKSDLKGNFTFMNEIFRKRYFQDDSAQTFKSVKLLQLVGEKYVDRCKSVAKKCMKDPEQTQRILLNLSQEKGKALVVQWDVKAILDSKGLPVEILCMGQDVTELFEKKSDLQKLVDIVSNQNQKLVEYTNIVSHNIRSHVANLLGLTNLIDLISDKKEQVDYFTLLKEAIQKLDETIMDLNVITRIQEQKKHVLEEISPRVLLEKVLSTFHGDGDILLEVDPDLKLNSVKGYLESIFTNLISNAFNYRSPKRRLSLHITSKRSDDGFLEISFEDNGQGIDLEKHGERIFKLYQTVGGKTNSKGLGLYLVKSQVEALGGEILVESKENEGSKFTVRIQYG